MKAHEKKPGRRKLAEREVWRRVYRLATAADRAADREALPPFYFMRFPKRIIACSKRQDMDEAKARLREYVRVQVLGPVLGTVCQSCLLCLVRAVCPAGQLKTGIEARN